MNRISDNDRIKAAAMMCAVNGGLSVSDALDLIDAVEREVEKRHEERNATCPDVETWMQAHDREPFQAAFQSFWWDGPKSQHILGREKLPADVWAAMTTEHPALRVKFPTREAAVAALRAALVKLGRIKA